MLNRALSISIIAILFLLSLQGAWLVRIIENEKTKFKNDDASEILRKNIKLENENENDNTIIRPNVHLVAYKNRKIKIKEEV